MKLKAVTGIVLTVLFIGMLALAFNMACAQPLATEWTRTYGGTNNEHVACVIQTSDGGYALAGYTYSFGAGNADMWLVKTNADGNILWNRTYGGTNDDSAESVVQTIDGGYALFGTTKSLGDTTGDFWLVKVDSFGNEQWNKTYSKAPRWDKGYSMAYTSDGGFILAGDAEWTASPYSQAWLIKTNSTGDKEWDYTYGQNVGLISTYARSVIECSNGGYAVAGYRYPNPTYSDVWLFKTASNGTMMWHKNYGKANYQDDGNWLVETPDGGYALAGDTQSFGAGSYDFWLVKTDVDGNHLWNKTYGGTSDDYARYLIQTSDGGYTMAGYTYSFGAGEWDGWLVKTDSSGNMQWNKTYGGASSDRAYSIVQTSDGGYVLAGDTESFGAGGRDGWLIKVAGIWPMFRHDPKHTGRSPFVGAQQANLKWTFTTGDAIRSSPAIAPDGTIYVGSNDHNVYAIDPDGSLRWNYTTAGAVYSSPAIDSDGTIYVGGMSADRKVYAINPNGTLDWSYTTLSDVYSSPAIDPSSGVIYVGANHDGSGNGRMYAFYPNGTLVDGWPYNPGTGSSWIVSSAAIREDGVILFGDFANPDGIFRALYPNGTVLWQTTLPSPYGENDIFSSAAIDSDGMIYVGGGNTNRELWALYPNGTIAWSYLTGGIIESSPAITKDGTIYVGSYDDKLYAINKNGTLKWTYLTDGDIYSSPAIGADGTIYVGSNDHNVYAIDPDGSLRWNYTTAGAVYSSPAIGSDGTIYIGSDDGKLYAIGPPPPVGGIWVPVDKFALLAPYVALASTILVATAATAIYVKRVKRRNKKQ